VNARVDVYLQGGGDHEEALRRGRLYAAAGADCVYPITLSDRAAIARFTELGVPVNILARTGEPGIAALAGLGVARISFGSGLEAVALAAVRAALARIAAT